MPGMRGSLKLLRDRSREKETLKRTTALQCGR